MKIPERPRAVLLSRVNEMAYTHVRPVIATSKNGKPGSFSIWSKRYKSRQTLRNWVNWSKQSQDILVDVEDCINEDMQRFVGLVGYDLDDDIDRFYMVYKPGTMQNNTSNMD